jgi:hypothetical protein
VQGNQSPQTCDVCGRTILRGEQTRAYVTADGDPRLVCDLCRTRAEHAGWVRADSAEAQHPLEPRERRRGGIGGWLRSRREAAGEEETQEEGGSQPGDGEEASGERSEHAPADEVATETPTSGRSRPREPRHVHAVPTDPVARMEAAMERFNRSEHSRTVAGLIRTLGKPQVSAGAAAGAPAEVMLTVAWELSWYQWSVDLSDDEAEVRPVAKGKEIGELDESARQWNAHADEAGMLGSGVAERQG